MPSLEYQRTVFAYHGCDASVASHVLGGGDFLASENDYDWLGKGIYFWEYGPTRAYEWALEQKDRKPTEVPVPSTIGAVIHLGRCFDLLDTRYTSYLKAAFPQYLAALEAKGLGLPSNDGRRNKAGDLLLRKLDCAVLNWCISELGQTLGEPFQTVRGVFVEGGEAFPGSCIMEKSHIQIAVRDPACIVGVFQPRS